MTDIAYWDARGRLQHPYRPRWMAGLRRPREMAGRNGSDRPPKTPSYAPRSTASETPTARRGRWRLFACLDTLAPSCGEGVGRTVLERSPASQLRTCTSLTSDPVRQIRRQRSRLARQSRSGPYRGVLAGPWQALHRDRRRWRTAGDAQRRVCRVPCWVSGLHRRRAGHLAHGCAYLPTTGASVPGQPGSLGLLHPSRRCSAMGERLRERCWPPGSLGRRLRKMARLT